MYAHTIKNKKLNYTTFQLLYYYVFFFYAQLNSKINHIVKQLKIFIKNNQIKNNCKIVKVF